jgi:hypothetical protein
LAWNASPTHTAASTSPRSRPETTAPDTASAASTSSRIISESEMLPRFSATAAGLATTTNAAISPAGDPASRDTARYSTTTVSAPSMACGATITHGWKPNARTARACTQNAPGSLSSVTVPAGSNAP